MCSSEWLKKKKKPWWASGAPPRRPGNRFLQRSGLFFSLLLLTASDLLTGARRRHAVINRVGGAGRAAAGPSDSCCFGGREVGRDPGSGSARTSSGQNQPPVCVVDAPRRSFHLRGHFTSEVISPELPAWLFTAAPTFSWDGFLSGSSSVVEFPLRLEE